jgi:hypothetical protein
MRKGAHVTAAQRLGLLVDWLNDFIELYRPDNDLDVKRWAAAGRAAIGRFLISFDGSPSAGHVETLRRSKDMPRFIRADMPHGLAMDADALQHLQVELNLMLQAGFGGPGVSGGSLPMPSLRFGVRNLHRGDAKMSGLKRRERRDYAAPGAYVLQVTGTTHDLVLYLVLHLLTAENMAGVLARCDRAPAPNNWQERCNRWFIRTGHGRRREFCSNACRTRHAAEQRATQHKKERVK